MANLNLDQLPTGAAPSGAEKLVVAQGGATVTLTVDQVAARAPVQDHNVLTNLSAGDAHPQYLNTFRGDARYPLQTRQVIAGNGLTGGGDLSSNRTFTVSPRAQYGITVTVDGVAVDILGCGLLPESVDATNDFLLMFNASEGRPRYVNFTTALGAGSGFVPTARVIDSGAGLTGGGDLSGDRTLAVGAGTGISVAADSVGLDTAHARNVDHSAVTFSAGTGLSGGGTLAANRSFSLDTANTRNVDHAAVTITGTNSVTGGGDLTGNRTLQLSGDTAAPGASQYYGTNAAGTKGWFAHAFSTLTGTISNAQVPAAAVTQHQASLNIAWAQITGTKNADQVGGYPVSLEAGNANSLVVRDASGFSRIRVLTNQDVSGDGVYLGYGNSNSGLTRIYGGGSTGANVSIDGSGNVVASGNVSSASDERLKDEVETIQNALAIVSNLRGVRFRWKNSGERQVGLIAQEVLRHVPEVVGQHPETEYLHVVYGNLVAVLIEAVKELEDRVKMLELNR